MTTRGFKEEEARQVANLIADVLDNPHDEANIAKVREQVSRPDPPLPGLRLIPGPRPASRLYIVRVTNGAAPAAPFYLCTPRAIMRPGIYLQVVRHEMPLLRSFQHPGA